MTIFIQAKFYGKLDDRREARVTAVLDAFDAWKFVPSGQRLMPDGMEMLHTAVDWSQDEDGNTEIEFEIEDEKAERVASELRACGLVTTSSVRRRS